MSETIEPRSEFTWAEAWDMADFILEEIAAAVTAEREACCRAVCPECKRGRPAQFGEYPVGGIKPYPQTWFHIIYGDIIVECKAAAIRARGK